MPASSTSRRYAQAIMQIAAQQGDFDDWQRDLRRIAAAMSLGEMDQLLDNPKVPLDAKRKVLEGDLQGISPLALNLVTLLVERGLSRLSGKIAADYVSLLNERKGIAEADVTTAVAIDDAEKGNVSRFLSSFTGKRVIVSANVDPDIIGGIVARIGDQLIDGSLRSSLDQLRSSLG